MLYIYVCVSVCVCVCEREREREIAENWVPLKKKKKEICWSTF